MEGQLNKNTTMLSLLANVSEEQTTLPIFLQDQTTPESAPSLESLPLYRAGKWLRLVGYPIILVFGTFGNVMSLLVLRRLQAQKFMAMNVFLMALAIFDLIILYTSPLWEFVYDVFGYRYFDANRVLCKLGTWVITCHATIAAWLLVAVTSQRALSVIWPHRVDVMCTRKASLIVVLAITVVLWAVYSHFLYGYDLVFPANSTQAYCSIVSETYARFLDEVFSWVELLIFSLLPFACIAINNGVMVFKLVQSVRSAKTSLASRQSAQVVNRERRARSVTLTVIVLSASFVVLTLPVCVFYIEFYISHKTATPRDVHYHALVSFLYALTYFLLDLNSAVNFYLYCLTGKRFRDELVKIIKRQT